MHVIERDEEDAYAFVVCNTGEGCDYHPQDRQAYPKTKVRTAIRIGAIPKERITGLLPVDLQCDG